MMNTVAIQFITILFYSYTVQVSYKWMKNIGQQVAILDQSKYVTFTCIVKIVFLHYSRSFLEGNFICLLHFIQSYSGRYSFQIRCGKSNII
jgi:hypothetical protein